MSTIQRKETTFAAAAHYAIYLGLFWIFKYLFLMGAEYNDLYMYIYNLLSIGTPILFYALACVYRERRLNGTICFGKVVAFGVFLFLFASFLEAVVIAINIIYVNPNSLSEWIQEACSLYSRLGIPSKYYAILENENVGPFTFIASQVMGNTLSGLIIALIIGSFVVKQPKKNQNS